MSSTQPTITNASHGSRRPASDSGGGWFSIYKPGQGYWTRTITAIGAGTLVLWGVGWLAQQLKVIPEDTIYYQAGAAVVIIVFFAALLFYLLNKPNIAEFMIATEAEMKKVNWPSRREIIGATAVVILGTIFIALLLLVVDLAFGWLFLKIGILEAGSAAVE